MKLDINTIITQAYHISRCISWKLSSKAGIAWAFIILVRIQQGEKQKRCHPKSDYRLWQVTHFSTKAVNDVQSAFSWAPKVARKCESKHWYACGTDGRSGARSVGHVITKFSGIGRFIYPWCSAGELRARSSAINSLTGLHYDPLLISDFQGPSCWQPSLDLAALSSIYIENLCEVWVVSVMC